MMTFHFIIVLKAGAGGGQGRGGGHPTSSLHPSENK